jgi:hypothetical protein
MLGSITSLANVFEARRKCFCYLQKRGVKMIINYSDQPVKKSLDSIFLAGPTPRDKSVPSWRPDALECLKRLGFDGIVYIPECSNGQAKINYDAQAEWELRPER